MFTIYATNHPAGLNANVATTAASRGVLLAIVAMAQTLVVLTSGIDLSVGMVVGARQLPCLEHRGRLAVDDDAGVLLVGCLCGAINGLIVIFGRLEPIVTTTPSTKLCQRASILGIIDTSNWAQIGSTPSSARCASTNDTITLVRRSSSAWASD